MEAIRYSETLASTHKATRLNTEEHSLQLYISYDSINQLVFLLTVMLYIRFITCTASSCILPAGFTVASTGRTSTKTCTSFLYYRTKHQFALKSNESIYFLTMASLKACTVNTAVVRRVGEGHDLQAPTFLLW